MPCRQSLADAAVTRRNVLMLLGASASPVLPGHAADDKSDNSHVKKLLQAGSCAVLLRHAATDPGVGDPPDFKLDDCRTQRTLSVAGREDAQRIGAWFASRKLKPRAVLSSAWCRCKDTADLVFGKHAVWAALNSTFGDRVQQPDQSALLRQALALIPARQFEVWVTHQVNISAIAGQGAAMGEALILDGEGRVLGRTAFA